MKCYLLIVCHILYAVDLSRKVLAGATPCAAGRAFSARAAPLTGRRPGRDADAAQDDSRRASIADCPTSGPLTTISSVPT